MRRGVPLSGSLFVLCFVLCFSGLVTGQEKASTCRIRPDSSSTEGRLRTAIFNADTELASKILDGNETFGLGAGLRYLEGQECAVVRSENRTQDPDIVAIQAIALNARRTRQTEKLANAIVISLELACECSLFDSTERDRMAGAIRQLLDNDDIIEYILAFGGLDDDSSKVSTLRSGRRLQQSSDTDSFVCAYCDPPRFCDPAKNWCPPGSQG